MTDCLTNSKYTLTVLNFINVCILLMLCHVLQKNIMIQLVLLSLTLVAESCT